jgi:hypothetical protein
MTQREQWFCKTVLGMHHGPHRYGPHRALGLIQRTSCPLETSAKRTAQGSVDAAEPANSQAQAALMEQRFFLSVTFSFLITRTLSSKVSPPSLLCHFFETSLYLVMALGRIPVINKSTLVSADPSSVMNIFSSPRAPRTRDALTCACPSIKNRRQQFEIELTRLQQAVFVMEPELEDLKTKFSSFVCPLFESVYLIMHWSDCHDQQRKNGSAECRSS